MQKVFFQSNFVLFQLKTLYFYRTLLDKSFIKKLLTISLLLLCHFLGRSNSVQNLELRDEFCFSEINVHYFGSDKDLKLEDILADKVHFKPLNKKTNQVLDAKKFYWLKFEIDKFNLLPSSQWLIEFYDFRIEKITFFNKLGVPDSITSGNTLPFSNRGIKHKNIVFPLLLGYEAQSVFYAKFYSSKPVVLKGRIINNNKFSEDSLNEYFLLSLFYGICIAMILYNLFLYLTINDPTYLYFIYHILGAVLFSLARDGLGFQYLWPNAPLLNKYMFNFSNTFMIIWEVMYARSFLNTSKTQPKIDKILKWVIAIRLIIYVLTTFVFPEYSNICVYDIAVLLILFHAGHVSFENQYRPATYFLLAFGFMAVGYILFVNLNYWQTPLHYATHLSMNFGLIGEMLLLSFALASRIKILQKEKIVAQSETIKQLTLNEELKDDLNKELEQKVLERTIALEAKNKELDAFVYKSSHDLKGPLNSISGLATIGMMEDDVQKMKEYFRLTRDTSRRLQSTIVDLLSLTKVKETSISKKVINIGDLLSEILEDFSHDENYSNVVITQNIHLTNHVVTDESLMKSIIQNLVENGLKYRDQRKETNTLHIEISTKNENLIIEVTDNGIGIDQANKEKIFDMFYKINPKSTGTGLGLHILKTAVTKLGGIIDLTSEKGKGTTFTVTIPK